MSLSKTSTARPAALHPFEGRDLNWLLDYRANSRPDHPFVVWEPFAGERESWSYRRFQQRVLRIAAGLARRGVVAGDTVLVHLDNGPEFELAWFACARLGAVVVTTNTRSAGDELSYFAEHSRAVGAITSPEYAGLFSQHVRGLRWLAVTARAWDGAPVDQPLGQDAFAALDGDPDSLPKLAQDAWRPGSVQYTSGTTSRPKGVLWTHGNSLCGAQGSAFHERLTPDSVHLVTMPQFHTNARTYSILPALWVGATVLLTPKFSASRFWATAARHGCTHASMLRFFYKILMQQEVPAQHSFQVWNAGAVDLAMAERFGLRSLGHYGSTETVGPALVTDLLSEARNGTVGHCAPGYGIRIVNEDGQRAAIGEVGHLQVHGTRGAQIFSEYLHSPEATRDSFTPDGWFITGDRVVLGEDGATSFVDRAKDMLKIAGENVSAAEVERVILEVAGVDEAAVVGRVDEMRGDIPVAFVLPRSSVAASEHAALAERINAACQSRLAGFKVPQQVILVSEMPRAALEKINKTELRKRLVAPAA
ncbi:MAG: AMP-binding protein [Burkholderiaceae bacterium]|nr:AMP-binding protein [Burkholderiaceae bacterium]